MYSRVTAKHEDVSGHVPFSCSLAQVPTLASSELIQQADIRNSTASVRTLIQVVALVQGSHRRNFAVSPCEIDDERWYKALCVRSADEKMS